MVFRRLLFVALLCLWSSTVLQGAEELKNLRDLKLPPVEKRAWRFKGFPIVAWWPPPGTATLEDFKAYKEAGFTIYPANPDSGFENSVKLAEQAGIPIMAWRSYMNFRTPKSYHPITFPKDNPNFVGWITKDEPKGMRRVVDAITEVNTLMREDPSRWAFFNLLPPHGQENNPGTEAIAEGAVRAGIPILSFDNYVIFNDGHDNAVEFYSGLERFRKVSVRYNVPFWAFALTLKHYKYRRPSESDLRWQHYCNLAYGAKGLWYFTYWGPTTGQDNSDKFAIVDPANGKKTELYEYVKTLNHAVLAMGDILIGLTNEDVVHTNPPKGQRPFKADQYWISNIAAKDALIGFFRDKDGTSYAMVVNKQHGMNKSAEETADTIEMTFAPAVKSIVAVNWLDGKPGPVNVKDRKVSLRIHGGTGVLLKADVSKG